MNDKQKKRQIKIIIIIVNTNVFEPKFVLQAELECRCKGPALLRVPQLLSVNMQRLVISRAGIPMLRYVGLKKYGSTLQDV